MQKLTLANKYVQIGFHFLRHLLSLSFSFSVAKITKLQQKLDSTVLLLLLLREWQKSELGHPPLKLRQQFPPFQVVQSKKGDYGALGDLRVRKGKIDFPLTQPFKKFSGPMEQEQEEEKSVLESIL